MKDTNRSKNAILIILDSNLKFQSIALLLNILETQPIGTRIQIFYVYDNESDLSEYIEMVLKTYKHFGFTGQREFLEIKSISTDEADEATKSFSIVEGNPITRTSFLRLFFTRWIPHNVEKILYLDIDIFITSSFNELFALDFSTPICAELSSPAALARGSHLYGHDSPYFNSGVLLINVKKWKAMDLEHKFLEIGSTQCYPFLDQDILNIVFKNNWTRIGRNFNFFHFYDLDEIDASFYTNPNIIHFAGPKPWSQIPITQFVAMYRHNFNRIRKLHDSLLDE
jgi:lipopolysaccharide biosynthesis glycosyltransferase